MNRLRALVVPLAAAAAAAVAAVALGAPTPEELTGRARALAGNFQLSLQGELFAAVKAGGPAKGIDVCSTRASQIAVEAARGTGWKVGRTALKLRNPKNAPDDWERQTLEEWKGRAAKGEDPATFEAMKFDEAEGTRTFRYMKPIVTASPCLGCHGTELAPEVAPKLKELYPDDQATGFVKGELRGAFTLSKPL